MPCRGSWVISRAAITFIFVYSRLDWVEPAD